MMTRTSAKLLRARGSADETAAKPPVWTKSLISGVAKSTRIDSLICRNAAKNNRFPTSEHVFA
jgi:hypothetical protein